MGDVSTKEEGFFEMGPNQSSESKAKYVHVASDRGYEDEGSFERLSNVASNDWWSPSINREGRLRSKGWNFHSQKHTSTTSHPRDFLISFQVSSFRRVFEMERPPTSEAEDFDGPDESNGVAISADVNLLELLVLDEIRILEQRVSATEVEAGHTADDKARISDPIAVRTKETGCEPDAPNTVSQGDAHSEGLNRPLTDGYGGPLTDQGQDQSPSF
ncbi:hypothetical protein PIB30_062553 [Stylosanthes scabra]|uniref:Uncharacterized protein n=1 Tax=Stylosanthes scabra TaxID=79078 RepID=A0ABU6VM47_9FABA|nr:hypothetical protein [Stylosanthes scabra]